ncbi:aspartate aminotransferase family protein [Blastococcus sp. TML/M2B]|uniref:pyridoxal phosphate-dependent decarboxylase family protein n=1 Tax=unclassified Blastococcus TaxID=2619396 RepID=UPI00190C4273|nr:MULTISPECIES: aspartate aminotransferase family protein [unclassified Blastococcus]MBN1094102.1 aspartate aminotransferase family protein [Blastococcus sp. TML/M2B]MBN1095778.1 aspartate aminotransferase family protein [Blastococcus sp. TML/C7B]
MSDAQPAAALPATGSGGDDVLAQLRANRHDDADWRSGRIFGLIFHPDDDGLEELLADVSREYLAENALNPVRFPSLARLERETADMVAGLLHGTPGAGGLTSGGTESIFMSVLVARETARKKGIADPVLVTAITAHPAFAKACHLLDMRQVRVPVDEGYRLDVVAMKAAIGPDTAMVVASAPCYPYGVIDPVEEVAALAREAGVLCHVDACLGGMMLPFWERLGEPVPPWDFRVEGVTSISADLHKYGYAFKGASVLLHRDVAQYRTQWWFDDGAWGGGMYGSPTTAGTRPAPPIAGAWAALKHLGEEGFLRQARKVRDATRRLQAGIEAIDELSLTSTPDLCVFQFGSDVLDMRVVADSLAEQGWFPNRQPGGLHVMVSPVHDRVADEFLAALGTAVEVARSGRTSDAGPATYGAARPGTGA